MEHPRNERRAGGTPTRPRLQDAEMVPRSRKDDVQYLVARGSETIGAISYGRGVGFTFRMGGIDVCHGGSRRDILSQVEGLGARRRAA